MNNNIEYDIARIVAKKIINEQPDLKKFAEEVDVSVQTLKLVLKDTYDIQLPKAVKNILKYKFPHLRTKKTWIYSTSKEEGFTEYLKI